MDALATIRPTEEVRVDVAKWLQGDPKHSYKVWRQHMPARGPDTPTTKPVKKVLKWLNDAAEFILSLADRWRFRFVKSVFGDDFANCSCTSEGKESMSDSL